MVGIGVVGIGVVGIGGGVVLAPGIGKCWRVILLDPQVAAVGLL
ncbi:hypothetical protein [Bartonella sp. B1099]|nr:hypothetical protein [Bartonella sp. B1099]